MIQNQNTGSKQGKFISASLFQIQYHVDLGGGWRSVIIDSQTKYEFVEQKHGGLSDDSSCWIGGSTDTEDEKFVPFFRYIASSTGKTKNEH